MQGWETSPVLLMDLRMEFCQLPRQTEKGAMVLYPLKSTWMGHPPAQWPIHQIRLVIELELRSKKCS